MKYYLNIDGGLGDMFCKMRFPEYKSHPIQHVQELLVREPDAEIELNVYSDNAGSRELFKTSVFSKVNSFKYSDYPGQVTNIPEYIPLFDMKNHTEDLIQLDRDNQEHMLVDAFTRGTDKICVFHPFTSTQYKIMPESIDKKEFIDVMIDKYGYRVIMLNQTTSVYFGRLESFDVVEDFNYSRPGLKVLRRYTDNISRMGFYLTAHYAKKIIAVDSAYIMLRNWILPIEKQNTLALLWNEFGDDHYYRRGLNISPNMYVQYKNITNVEKLVDKFMEL